MSRLSSLSNDDILGPFEMMNVHSNLSIFTEGNPSDEVLQPKDSFTTPLGGWKPTILLVDDDETCIPLVVWFRQQ
jgi:hypothetical protein